MWCVKCNTFHLGVCPKEEDTNDSSAVLRITPFSFQTRSEDSGRPNNLANTSRKCELCGGLGYRVHKTPFGFEPRTCSCMYKR